MRPLSSSLVALLSGALAICLAAPPVAAQTPSPAPSPSTSSKAAVARYAVDIKNFAYVPETLVVPVGATVVFTESDPVLHTVTAKDKSFDSGDLTQGKTWSHTFTKAGTFPYGCTYHALMHGTIVVK